MSRKNSSTIDPNKEHSESEKRKAKEANQLQPKDCKVPTYGEKPVYPPYYEDLMKIAEKYPLAFDSSILFNEPALTRFDPLPVDPNFDYTAFDDGPLSTTPESLPGDEAKAAIRKLWEAEAEATKERDKSAQQKEKEAKELAEQKEKEAKELAEQKEKFKNDVAAFYAIKGITFIHKDDDDDDDE